MLPAGTVAVADPAVGRDQYLDLLLFDGFDLSCVSVAGVGHHRTGRLIDPVAVQVRQGGLERRRQVPEVGRIDGDLGGENDLALVDSGLRVVGLPGWAAFGVHHPRVGVRHIDPLRAAPAR